MAITLVLVALLLGQAPEWTIQHFQTPEECAEAGAAIAQAYQEELPLLHLSMKCTISQEA